MQQNNQDKKKNKIKKNNDNIKYMKYFLAVFLLLVIFYYMNQSPKINTQQLESEQQIINTYTPSINTIINTDNISKN
jgi:hypothetical protein